MKTAILLPYKENYTKKLAGAASLWVSDYNKYSKLSKCIVIYGNLNNNLKPLSKNFKNIEIKTRLLSKTREYTNKFLKLIIKKQPDFIEVHNRPESAHIVLKAEITSELILVFHNNPLELSGSKSISDRIFLLDNCFKIFFVSNWVKNKFFENLPFTNKNNCEIIHPWTSPLNKFPKKEHIITFSGKLNYSKGYDLFSDVIPKILNKHKLWKAVVLGSEPREKIILNQEEIRIQKLKDQEMKDDQSYNLHWSSLKNNKDNLSVHYAGKKNAFARFLSPQRRLKLKKIIERYKSRLS